MIEFSINGDLPRVGNQSNEGRQEDFMKNNCECYQVKRELNREKIARIAFWTFGAIASFVVIIEKSYVFITLFWS